jgi:hypothetical protein
MATLLRTIFASLLLLSALVSAKFLWEDRLGPIDNGIRGALEAPSIDILLLGSSHTRQGYDARLLEQVTGKKVYVVAYDGLDPVSMLPVVSALLADPARRPVWLILEANCVRLSQPPDIEDPRLFFESPPRVKRELLSAYLQSHPGAEAYLDMFTLVANRGNDLIVTWPLVHRSIDALSYHGGYINKNMPGLAPEAFSRLTVPIAGDRPNPDQLAALRSMIALAKASHVMPWLADTPMPAPVAAQPAMVALHRDFEDLAAAAQVPYLRIIDGFSTGDPALFHDSSHLSTTGRELYTQLFARALLAQKLAGLGRQALVASTPPSPAIHTRR